MSCSTFNLNGGEFYIRRIDGSDTSIADCTFDTAGNGTCEINDNGTYSCTLPDAGLLGGKSFTLSGCTEEDGKYLCKSNNFSHDDNEDVNICPYTTASFSFVLDYNPFNDTCQEKYTTCNIPDGICIKPPTNLWANSTFTQIIDNISRLRYAKDRNDSCNWDCKSYGPYCGDGFVQTQYGEECEEDQACTLSGGSSGQKKCNKSTCKFESEGECVSVPTPEPEQGESSRCGDGTQDANEGCDLGPDNGKACTPAYNIGCTGCSTNCLPTYREPEERCGDGIIQKDEKCDFNRNLAGGGFDIWVTFAERAYYSRAAVFDPAHSSSPYMGYLARKCSEELNSKVNINTMNAWNDCKSSSDWDYELCQLELITRKKGDKACINNCMTVSSGCVECGIDAANGVEVSGTILNVIDPTTSTPLYGSDGGGPIDDSTVTGMLDLFYVGDDINGLYSDLIRDKRRVAYFHRLHEKDWKNFTLRALPIPDTTPDYNTVTAKINSNGLCSSSEGERYQLIINSDLEHPRDFPVYSRPSPGQYDLVLSPVISKTNQPQNIRIVVRWKGSFQLYGGFFKLGGFGTGPLKSSLLMGQSATITEATGLEYFLNKPNPNYGIWYHGTGFTSGEVNAEAFTVSTTLYAGARGYTAVHVDWRC